MTLRPSHSIFRPVFRSYFSLLLVIMVGLAPSLHAATTDTDTDEETGGESKATTKVPYGELSGNVSFASDYIFRGVSMTDYQPALQGGLEWSQAQGIYVGAWGSNVHTPDMPDTGLELDVYAGIAFNIAPKVELNLAISRFNYFTNSENDAWDFPARVKWKGFEVGFDFSPSWGTTNAASWYFTGGWKGEVIYKFTVGAGIGYTIVNPNSGEVNYADFRADISHELFGLVIDLSGALVSTTQLGSEAAPRLVLTITKNF